MPVGPKAEGAHERFGQKISFHVTIRKTVPVPETLAQFGCAFSERAR